MIHSKFGHKGRIIIANSTLRVLILTTTKLQYNECKVSRNRCISGYYPLYYTNWASQGFNSSYVEESEKILGEGSHDRQGDLILYYQRAEFKGGMFYAEAKI